MATGGDGPRSQPVGPRGAVLVDAAATRAGPQADLPRLPVPAARRDRHHRPPERADAAADTDGIRDGVLRAAPRPAAAARAAVRLRDDPGRDRGADTDLSAGPAAAQG